MLSQDAKRSSAVQDPASPHKADTAVPKIELPKGGGAIRGIGEKFAANPVTGTGTMTVPISTSAGRSGFGPQLSLAYDSGSGNGPFGFGWSMALPSITRKTSMGLPQYLDASESDVFILSDAEDLVPVLSRNKQGKWEREEAQLRTVASMRYRIDRYRPRVEGLFARIERWTNVDDACEVFWRSISEDNTTTWYGKTAESRIADPADASRIFSWLICQSHDDKGNVIVYGYKAEDSANIVQKAHERNRSGQARSAQRYLKRIRYGNRSPYFPVLHPDADWPEPSRALAEDGSDAWLFEAVLDYGDHDAHAPTASDAAAWPPRADPFSNFRAGFEVRTYRTCRRVLMFHHFQDEEGIGRNCLVRSTDFSYSDQLDPDDVRNPVYTFLRAITESGYRRNEDRYYRRSMPPVEFEYSEPVVQDVVEEVDPRSMENLPIGLDAAIYRWTDLHGEGLPGILTEQGGTWFYKRNLSPLSNTVEFAPLEAVGLAPNVTLGGGAEFMDLAGDGQPDVVLMEGPTPGLYEHDEGEGWRPFRPFTMLPSRNLRDPNLKFIDLDGDGNADMLITENEAFVWHAAHAEDGFGPARRVAQALDEEKGPRVVFADGTQSIYLADFVGDGLTDIVRVRNGEVCYWPNLGYGRFGTKVTMDNAPWFDNPDQFDHQRIRMADIDGSGTTDIIYLHRDGVCLYFNQSGNSWSQPQMLKVFVRIDDFVNIAPTDLLGNGTACLVWSSPLPGDVRRPMAYVNLMGGSKPHLLVKATNNLGAETRVAYAPSTKFYLQDKRDGKPWAKRLPFPVHVVERTEIYDHVSHNRLVTRYAYHHGYFDGEEREFRGFGMVEQWDTQQLAALAGGRVPADNDVGQSHVPPVHTKSWFHTGACSEKDCIAHRLEHEYYREPGMTASNARSFLLADTIVPPGLTLAEEREACRALKGSMLRQEVYADDAAHPGATPAEIERARTPYTVTERNFTIRTLQHRGANRHAVFYVHAAEALNYNYERNASDPRILHTLALEVDDFGNVLKEAAIGYGRRMSPLAQAWDRERQTTALLTYTENRFTNAIGSPDSHRNPLPCEAVTFELTGYTPTGPAGRYEASDLVEATPGAPASVRHKFNAPEVAYEASASGNERRRRIECSRTLYRRDDLGGLLPLGELQRQALPGESFQLAYTEGLLSQLFKRPGPGQEDEPLLPDPVAVLGGQAGARGGYLQSQDLRADGRFPASDADGQWWLPSGQSFYNANPAEDTASELAQAREHFFLPRRFRDPFGQYNFVDYDAYDLLMAETRDALGNRVTVDVNDYRVLQPCLARDPNRNQSAVAFDALGMVVGTAVMGKQAPAPVEGDTLAGFAADLTQEQLDDFFDGARPDAATALLKDATTRILYDLERFRRTRQAHPDEPEKWAPACAATLVRETHAGAVPPPQGLRIQLGFSYSDGFGREIQKKIPAEAGPVPQRYGNGKIIVGADGQPLMMSSEVSPRWVGSGWTVFNNKGNPVRQFEPFFTDTHHYEFDVRIGVSPVLFYDPTERLIATLHPNHSYEKFVFDPWQETVFDVNDTCAPRPAQSGRDASPQTGDPRTDPDIGGLVAAYFEAQPATWLTWYTQRIDGALGVDEQKAAQRAAAHADTPTVTHLDALGRPFLTFRFNRVACPGHDHDGSEDSVAIRAELDIEGNQRAVRDAIREPGAPLGRVVMRYAYDMLGDRLYQHSMEHGARWMLNDAAGQPIRFWDSRGHNIRIGYDALRRPVEKTVRGTSGQSDPRMLDRDVVVEAIEYGEAQPNAEALNLRGRIVRHFDSAGIVTNGRIDASGQVAAAYDFKGNLLHNTRQLVSDYTAVPDWSQQPVLDDELFEGSTRYDALDRPIQSIAPRSSLGRGKFNVIQPVFNEANLLDRVDVWLERAAGPDGLLDPNEEVASPVGVSGIAYDAKGQRMRMDYKNGASTFYAYDPLTFRLTDLMTSCSGGPGKALQKLHFTYDAVDNITHIEDDAQQTIYFMNQRVDPGNDYVYDALYRLVQASGREHLGQGGSAIAHSHNDAGREGILSADAGGRFAANDGHAMASYVERYVYDAVGNFLQMQHRGGSPSNGGYTRSFDYLEPSLTGSGSGDTPPMNSNRLTRTMLNPAGASPQAESYLYDAHGNVVRMPHLGAGQPGPNMQWDYKDQLRQADLGGGGTAYYVYDASGQRVRKVWEKGAGLTEERIYLGGFEIFRKHRGAIGDDSLTLERETLHVMDDRRRIALVETRTLGMADSDEAPRQSIRYQADNHLGSACLELDAQAHIISYEEYAPYGSTTYQAVRSQTETAKRYRFTGKERDEESGLYYHGARYYAPWLGRWTACDPAGMEDSPNLYQYCFDNPVGFIDPDGLSGKKLAIVMHNESKPSGTRVAKPKAPEKPKKPNIKVPGKKASAKDKEKYKDEKNKADKAYEASMKKYTTAKKQYDSDLKKYQQDQKKWEKYDKSHNEYDASKAALKEEGYEVVTVDTGKAFLQALKKAGPIKELVVLTHGTPFGLGGEGPGAGVYTDKGPGGTTPDPKRAAKLADLEKMIKDKEITFEKDATIVLGGCRSAGGKEGTEVGKSTWTKPMEDTFAYRLATITGREVIGSEGVTSYNANQQKSTPMRFSNIAWHRFTQQGGKVQATKLEGQYLNVVTRKTSKSP
jgi:RHS repeat-associated protein